MDSAVQDRSVFGEFIDVSCMNKNVELDRKNPENNVPREYQCAHFLCPTELCSESRPLFHRMLLKRLPLVVICTYRQTYIFVELRNSVLQRCLQRRTTFKLINDLLAYRDADKWSYGFFTPEIHTHTHTSVSQFVLC